MTDMLGDAFSESVPGRVHRVRMIWCHEPCCPGLGCGLTVQALEMLDRLIGHFGRSLLINRKTWTSVFPVDREHAAEVQDGTAYDNQQGAQSTPKEVADRGRQTNRRRVDHMLGNRFLSRTTHHLTCLRLTMLSADQGTMGGL